MSRPLPPSGRPPALSPEAQLAAFADLLRPEVAPGAIRALVARAEGLGLALLAEETVIYAALARPSLVQRFLNEQIYYNDDHVSPEQEETALSPRSVLGAAHGHCFEGALLAYAALLLHGHEPRLVLLEATQDVEHNLVVYRDPRRGGLGAVAHSSYPRLDGRDPDFPTLRELVASYHPYYYSGRTNDRTDLRLVGYSEPFALEPRFGVDWITAAAPQWRLYSTYVDGSVRFRYLDDGEAAPTHLYPLVQALAAGWIRVDDDGSPRLDLGALPPGARRIYEAFFACWVDHGRPLGGEALALEERFFALTGTTPIDLHDNAGDLVDLLGRGFSVADLIGARREG